MIISNVLRKESSFHDSLYYHFSRCFNDRQLYPKSGGYESMKSYGVDIVSNDSIRKRIMDVYQLDLKRVVEFGQANPKYDIPLLLLPYQQTHFRLTDEVDRQRTMEGVALPVLFYDLALHSFIDLQNDQLFLMDLQRSFSIRRQKIGRHIASLKRIDALVTAIDEELKRLNGS